MENNLTFHVSTEESEEKCDTSHTEITKRLCEAKNKIGRIRRSEWNCQRTISNKFEDIFLFSKLTNGAPISRAYYKITEICKDFSVGNMETSIDIMCLAEAPGAFVQYFLDKRDGIGDTIVCNTLQMGGNIPEFHVSILGSEAVHTYFGPDHSGDICKYNLIVDLVTKKQKFDIITADGGMDTSVDYNSQDKQCKRLILSEIVIGIGCLKKDGSMIIKIFDIEDIEMIHMLSILANCFVCVHLTKPRSSRPANSEKYLVCKGFLGYDGIHSLIHNIHNNKAIVADIGKSFENKMINIRNKFVSSQIESINMTIHKDVNREKRNLCNEWNRWYKFMY